MEYNWLALTIKKRLEEVLPRWRYRAQGGGHRPGVTSKRALMGASEEEDADGGAVGEGE